MEVAELRRERVRLNSIAYRIKYPEKVKEYNRLWHIANKDLRKEQARYRSYGIDSDAYQSLLKEQNGKCGICHQPEINEYMGTVRELAVDHCHETGAVRGLLCFKCNTGLGQLGDTIESLQEAIIYLQKTTTDKEKI